MPLWQCDTRMCLGLIFISTLILKLILPGSEKFMTRLKCPTSCEEKISLD
jgi:hypothetical protein